MNKFFSLLLLCIFFNINTEAKKVKFSVNMKYEVVNPLGIHIAGDFQDEAGFPSDWDPATTQMIQETSDTNIYSIVLNIPAFRAYEFKFVNGIFGYEQEFVPLESRVNYNFLDSRWIYVDSLANDTLNIPSIVFGGNAPVGKRLLRFYVDMQNQSINALGVHVAGAFQNWNPTATRMYSFDGNVFEYITYVDSGNTTTSHEYLFVNGNTINNYETLPGWCSLLNNHRYVNVSSDTMLQVVCYASCSACSTASVNDIDDQSKFSVFPNPMENYATIFFNDNSDMHTVIIKGILGNVLLEQKGINESSFRIEKGLFNDGVYFVSVLSSNNKIATLKLVIE